MAESPTLTQRHENFPYASFHYLQTQLMPIRCEVMKVAAGLAQDEDSHPDFYTVEKKHIDQALRQMLSDSTRCLQITELA